MRHHLSQVSQRQLHRGFPHRPAQAVWELALLIPARRAQVSNARFGSRSPPKIITHELISAGLVHDGAHNIRDLDNRRIQGRIDKCRLLAAKRNQNALKRHAFQQEASFAVAQTRQRYRARRRYRRRQEMVVSRRQRHGCLEGRQSTKVQGFGRSGVSTAWGRDRQHNFAYIGMSL